MRTLKYYVLTVYVERTGVYRSTVVTSLRAVKSLIDGLVCWFDVYEFAGVDSVWGRLHNIAYNRPSCYPTSHRLCNAIRKAGKHLGTLADYSVGHVVRFDSLAMAG